MVLSVVLKLQIHLHIGQICSNLFHKKNIIIIIIIIISIIILLSLSLLLLLLGENVLTN